MCVSDPLDLVVQRQSTTLEGRSHSKNTPDHAMPSSDDLHDGDQTEPDPQTAATNGKTVLLVDDDVEIVGSDTFTDTIDSAPLSSVSQASNSTSGPSRVDTKATTRSA